MERTVLVTALCAALVPVFAGPAAAAPNPSDRVHVNPSRGSEAVLRNIERNPDILFKRSGQGLERFTAVGEAFGCV